MVSKLIIKHFFLAERGCLAKCTSVLPKYHLGGREIHTFFIKIGSFFEIKNFDQNSSFSILKSIRNSFLIKKRLFLSKFTNFLTQKFLRCLIPQLQYFIPNCESLYFCDTLSFTFSSVQDFRCTEATCHIGQLIFCQLMTCRNQHFLLL